MAAHAALASDTATLGDSLTAARNPDGGWGYYIGKASRIEPAAWIALASPALAPGAVRWLLERQGRDGWCRDDPQAPVNYGFNGLALLALLAANDTSKSAAAAAAQAMLTAKGLTFGPSPVMRQDNSLEAWPWIDGTFSWVEPTACCLLALKRARARGVVEGAAVEARIAIAERMLVDRTCDGGGWNYGNAHVFDKNLAAHVPTTALALLALQDRRDLPAVEAGLAFLTNHAESSGMALALTAICLTAFDRDEPRFEGALRARLVESIAIGNAVTLATLLMAVSDRPDALHPLRLRSS